VPPKIEDLAIVGDRHTAAVISKSGEVVWYCPGRFDAPSLLGGLLDPATGGMWQVDLPDAVPERRRYVGDSGVLETVLRHARETDWMTLPRGEVPRGMLCRSFGAAPATFRLRLLPRSDYARRIPQLIRATGTRIVIDDRFQLQASHPAHISGAAIEVRVPRGEQSWAVLSDLEASKALATADRLNFWRTATLDAWRELAERYHCDGDYGEQVKDSLRALRLLIFEETGAVAAAVTTSLPEIIGGKRNFDYRFCWLRDAGLAVRALTRFEPEGFEARRFLDFVSGICGTGYSAALDPVTAVGGERVPDQRRLKLAGYYASHPNWIGNLAGQQLQTGSLASFLLAAVDVYERLEPRLHWEVTSEVANFLVANWRRRDSGIWELRRRRQFTTSKVLAVCALEGMAKFAENSGEAARYRTAAGEIRGYVARYCRTREGGYAAVAGEKVVDVSAALYPVFGYSSAADAAMDATIRELEACYRCGEALYHRYLENAKVSRREGAFLAGTFWVAHYWIARGELERGRRIMDAGLRHANDLGLFAEEVDAGSGRLLGNFPLALVHASFLAAVADYRDARGATPGRRSR
jgi:alpha,alpha-trehalase